jgi:hypothetical protein
MKQGQAGMVSRQIQYILGLEEAPLEQKPRILAWRWGVVLFCVAFWAALIWLFVAG